MQNQYVRQDSYAAGRAKKKTKLYLRDRCGLTVVGDSCISAILEAVDQQYQTSSPILVQGEPGTGKLHIAKAIHHGSFADKFALLDCSRISEEAIYSTLGGYFESTENYTLIFYHVDNLPRECQSKFLDIIHTEARGYTQSESPRIVSTSGLELETKVAEGSFNEKLFGYLSGHTFTLLPLRDRLNAMPHLVRYFISDYFDGEGEITVDPSVLQLFKRLDWPGNIKQLKDLVLKMLPGCTDTMGLENLPHVPKSESDPTPQYAGGVLSLDNYTRRLIDKALIVAGDNMAHAARILGINRTKLYRDKATLDQMPELPEETRNLISIPAGSDLSLAAQYRLFIRRAFRTADQNIAEAARLLGINRTKLYRKAREYGLKLQQKKRADLSEEDITAALRETGGDKSQAAKILRIRRGTLYDKMDKFRLHYVK